MSICTSMTNQSLHGVAGQESSQHDSAPTYKTIYRMLRMRGIHNVIQKITTCEPPHGTSLWAYRRTTFECRRAAPILDQKTSDQQLGHYFWVPTLAPYGGLLFGTAD